MLALRKQSRVGLGAAFERSCLQMKGMAPAVSNSKLKQIQKSFEGDFAKQARIVKVRFGIVFQNSVPSKRGSRCTHRVPTICLP